MKIDALKAVKTVHKDIEITIELISPQMAAEYLKDNYGNRQASEKHIKYLSEQMKANKWKLTHQGIAFDKKGKLRDGQHRLYAVIRSMKDTEFVVFRGLETDTFEVMDTGKNRQASDVLFIEGFTKNNNVAAYAIRQILEWEQGRYTSILKGHYVTNYMILNFMRENHKELQPIVDTFAKLASAHKHIMAPGMAVMFAWICGKVKGSDQKTANAFFEQLYTGANMSENSPQLYLRNFLQQEQFQPHRTKGNVKRALIILGWNKFRKNQGVIKMWHWNAQTDSFPIPL